MAQTVPIDAYLGTARAGTQIGAAIYQLDGTTSYAAFATAGWYQAPDSSGAWHHAGLSLPDAGGVVAVGVAGTEYLRGAVPAAIWVYALEGNKSFEEVVTDLWAVTVGDSAADDGDDPTVIVYDGPDGTAQRTHTLTPTTRAVS